MRTITVQAYVVWLLCACFYLIDFFLRVFPNTINDLLESDLQLSTLQFSIFVGSFYAIYAMIQIMVGYLYDRFSLAKLISMACYVAAIGMLLMSVSQQFSVLIIGRLLTGFGAAFGFLGLLRATIDYFPSHLIGRLTGATQLVAALGSLLALSPFVYLLAHTGNHWQVILQGVAVCLILLGSLCLLCIGNKPRVAHQQQAIFLRVLFTQKKYVPVYILGLYALFIYAAVPVLGASFGMRYLQELGFSSQQASWILSALWLGLLVGGPINGFISDHMRSRLTLLYYLPLLGLIVSIAFLSAHHGAWYYSICLFLLSYVASAQLLTFAVIADITPAKIINTCFGINNSINMLGGFLAPILCALLMRHFHQATAKGLLLMPLFFICAFLVALILGQWKLYE